MSENLELATGRLAFGLLYEGRRHRDFTMRLPTLADNLAAIEAYPDGSSVQHEVVMFARCMQTLGDVPQEAITYELLANGLMPVEYEVINDALGGLKKSCSTRSQASPLSATDIAVGEIRRERGERAGDDASRDYGLD